MRLPGLVGPTYQERSLPFDAQRCINFYPVMAEGSKTTTALYGTPGLNFFSGVGLGPQRGGYVATNGRVFVVSGAGLYEVDEAGNHVLRGNLNQSNGIVSIAENGFQLAVCDGESLYILNYDDNVFGIVTDDNLPAVATVTFIDGYFVCNEVGSGRFYISALYDGTDWHPLDFATAESSPDELLRVINSGGMLWLLGETTTEIWTNTGDSAFPFERISGAKLQVGIAAPHTATPLDNSLFFVGRDEEGMGIVYRTSGFTPKRISTHAIEMAVQKASDPMSMRAWSYQQDGHVFYVITGGGLETSLVYDLTTQLWHERAYMNHEGEFEQHLGVFCLYAFGRHIVGDRRNGNLYELSQDIYSDNGEPLVAERVFSHFAADNQRFKIPALTIDLESGVGNENIEDPMLSLRISKDGARTWGNWHTASMGKIGEYLRKARFRRLGEYEQVTFAVRISDAVKRALLAAYVG